MHLMRFIIALLVLAAVIPANAQTFKLGPEGGMAFIAGPVGFTRAVGDGGLGYSHPPAFGLRVEFASPSLSVTFVTRAVYLPLSGSGTFNNPIYVPSAQGSWKTKQELLVFGAGVEWPLFSGPVSPFAVGELLVTSIGKTKVDVTNSLGTTHSESGGGTRLGASIGIGVSVPVLPRVDLDFSARYSFHSLVGTEPGENSVGTIPVTVAVLFTL